MVVATHPAGQGDTKMGRNDEGMSLEVLENPIVLDLKLNDLRIIVNCFNAVSYILEHDGEPCQDTGTLDLKLRLEKLYVELLRTGPGIAETTAS
jgi:hypothetical protein